MKRSVQVVLFILLLVALMGCQQPTATPNVPAGANAPQPAAPTSQQSIPTAITDVPRISLQELRSLMDAEEPLVLIDTRDRDHYDSGHVPGALPLDGPQVARHYRELPKDTLIVLYCN